MYTTSMQLPSIKEMELMSFVAGSEMTGRELAAAYKRETNRSISYGTLYTTLARLEKSGWMKVRIDVDADGRLKFFSLSHSGRAALASARVELGRLVNFGLKPA